MPFRITLEPSHHEFVCDESQTVLDAALQGGHPLPYGCRNGACGSCKGKVIAGAVDHGDHSPNALTDVEKQRGFALFCCARPRSDLVIECREVDAARDIPVKRMPCRVERMTPAAGDVMILHLRLPANERLQFLPGQYIDILLKGGARRSYSIANPPHDDELLELHVRAVPGGRFSAQVFAGMKERDILRLEGPRGSFFLREDSDKPIVFVAGGTGFAPVRSIIEHALFERCRRPMVLYWGARTRADLYLNALAESWSASRALRYVPVLSEPRPEDQWSGRTGLVHRAVLEDHPDLSGCQVYVCGGPAMVEAARRDFTRQCALPEEEFFSDSFAYASADPSAP